VTVLLTAWNVGELVAAGLVLSLPFLLANRTVTNAEYRALIDDGGYHNVTLWLCDRWARLPADPWLRTL